MDLCASLASVAITVSTLHVHPLSIAPFLACHLIALDKHLGAHWIIAKAILSITQTDIQDASGCQRMCNGQIFVIKASVLATQQAFDSQECEAALFVYTTNAFNSLNRLLALHTIRCLCSPIVSILINTYRAPWNFLCIMMSSFTGRNNTRQPTIHGHVWPSNNSSRLKSKRTL